MGSSLGGDSRKQVWRSGGKWEGGGGVKAKPVWESVMDGSRATGTALGSPRK